MIDYDELDYEDETLFNPDVVSDKLARIVDGILKNPRIKVRSWGVEFTGFGSTQPRYRLFRTYPSQEPGLSGLLALDTVSIESSIESAVKKFSDKLDMLDYRVNENFTITNGSTTGALDPSRLVSGTITANMNAADTVIHYRDPFDGNHVGVDLAQPLGVKARLTI